MLSDRDYMRRSPNSGGRPSSPLLAIRMVWALIIINVVVFFITTTGHPSVFNRLAFVPKDFLEGNLWSIVTAMFMHGGFFHLFCNMWGLYIFGTLVAPLMGPGRFLTLYLVGGLTGNLLYLAFNLNSGIALVGASGALFAVMMAVAMMTPDIRFMLMFPPIPMKARTLVIVYAILELLMVGDNSNIAHLAHLGGLLGGYIVVKLLLKSQIVWDIIPSRRPGGSRGPHFYKPGGERQSYRNPEQSGGPSMRFNPDEPVSQREIDYLLDKLSNQGINSLTPEETARLRHIREQLRKR